MKIKSGECIPTLRERRLLGFGLLPRRIGAGAILGAILDRQKSIQQERPTLLDDRSLKWPMYEDEAGRSTPMVVLAKDPAAARRLDTLQSQEVLLERVLSAITPLVSPDGVMFEEQ